MGKRWKNAVPSMSNIWVGALFCTAAPFFFGGILGCFFAVGSADNAALKEYMAAYLTAVSSDALPRPSFASIAWDFLSLPGAVLILGFTALGVIGIPAVMAAHGFLLAFSIASFLAVGGAGGGILAFVTFGLPEMLILPALFILSLQAVVLSRTVLTRIWNGKGGGLSFPAGYLRRCLSCAVFLALCATGYYLLLPDFLSGVAVFC